MGRVKGLQWILRLEGMLDLSFTKPTLAAGWGRMVEAR